MDNDSSSVKYSSKQSSGVSAFIACLSGPLYSWNSFCSFGFTKSLIVVHILGPLPATAAAP